MDVGVTEVEISGEPRRHLPLILPDLSAGGSLITSCCFALRVVRAAISAAGDPVPPLVLDHRLVSTAIDTTYQLC
jgi:hypothetical protein